MFDHVSITLSDIAVAERFYDAIMNVLGVVKVGREDWLGHGERTAGAYGCRSGHPPRQARGAKPRDDA